MSTAVEMLADAQFTNAAKEEKNKSRVLQILSQMAMQPSAENIKHPFLYDAGRVIQKNPVSNFLFGGLGDWLMTTAKGGRTSAMQNVMAGMDATPPGLDDALLKVAPGLLGMTAWHGSPHMFNKFDISKIGTGEGAQAYGHGLYFAENPAVAKQYRPNRSYVGRAMAGTPDNVEWDAARIAQDAADQHGADAASFLESVAKQQSSSKRPDQIAETQKVLDAVAMIRDGKIKSSGHLYNVDIPDSAIDNMLDWDKPLSEAQAEMALKAFGDVRPVKLGGGYYGVTRVGSDGSGKVIDGINRSSAEEAMAEFRGIFNGRKGEDAYRLLAGIIGGPENASAALKKTGIPGIKYLDQGSRAGGKGTRNFVIFDDSLVTIKGRE